MWSILNISPAYLANVGNIGMEQCHNIGMFKTYQYLLIFSKNISQSYHQHSQCKASITVIVVFDCKQTLIKLQKLYFYVVVSNE